MRKDESNKFFSDKETRRYIAKQLFFDILGIRIYDIDA